MLRIVSRFQKNRDIEVINRNWIKDTKSGLYLLGKQKAHHSFSDWTWSIAPAGWHAVSTFELSTLRYVSSPSSVWMRVYHVTLDAAGIATCDLAAVQNLKEGRIISWLWATYASADTGSRVILGAQGDAGDSYQSITIPVAWGVWGKRRGTWWNSYDAFNVAKLATQASSWDGAAWVDEAIVYITRLSGATNKCGIGTWCKAGQDSQSWWDDTEIWG